MPYLEARETKYILRPHPLPVQRVNHAFAESCLLYKLVKILKKLAIYHKLIHTKIIERTHSHAGFSTYVVNIMIDRYSYECILYPSHSKKYHKYITNIPQIYHKSTTKCDIVPQKCDIVPRKGVVYYKM